MKDFLFRKSADAQPTPVVPETPETPETPIAPETLAVPETPEAPGVPEAPEIPETPEASKPEEISTAYILEQLELIRKDTAHLEEAMSRIAQMERGDETRAMALSNLVVTREETNQKLISLYSELLLRKTPSKPIKMPSFDGWGQKWSDWGQKVKKSVELTPEQDAELKEQIDEAADALQETTEKLKEMARKGGKSVQRYVNEAMSAIRSATHGKVDIRLGDSEAVTLTSATDPKKGSTLDAVADLLRDSCLSVEEKQLIFDYVEEIRDVNEETQTKILEILGDAALALEEKKLILDHLEDLQELS